VGLDAGASKDVFKVMTHPRRDDAFDLYRTLAWQTCCEAVLKLKVELKEGTLLRLPKLAAVGAGGELAETSGSEGEG
jgi:hypothetical protein